MRQDRKLTGRWLIVHLCQPKLWDFPNFIFASRKDTLLGPYEWFISVLNNPTDTNCTSFAGKIIATQLNLLWDLARYSVHMTATWFLVWNITEITKAGYFGLPLTHRAKTIQKIKSGTWHITYYYCLLCITFSRIEKYFKYCGPLNP